MHGKWRGRENVKMRCAFRPCGGDRVLLSVNIEARIAKRSDSPRHGSRRLRRSGHAPANLISQAPQIFRKRRFPQGVGDDLWRNLLAKRFASRRARLDIRFRRVADARERIGLGRRQLTKGGKRASEKKRNRQTKSDFTNPHRESPW